MTTLLGTDAIARRADVSASDRCLCKPQVLNGHPELDGAAWGWGVETASHALRLLFGGVFDRFPRLKIILGHMGEGLPFQRWRFDSRFAVYSHGVKLARAPSGVHRHQYRDHDFGRVLARCAGRRHRRKWAPRTVMFSVDYPYESTEVAARVHRGSAAR
ncbi:amidohydrolase family protein [Cupriavidus basilensis]